MIEDRLAATVAHNVISEGDKWERQIAENQVREAIETIRALRKGEYEQ